MIIECVGCGFSKYLDPHGTAEELEGRVNEAIAVEGWRYSPNYKGFVCPSCCKGGGDNLLVAFKGKIRKASKKDSYMNLMYDFMNFVIGLKMLEELAK